MPSKPELHFAEWLARRTQITSHKGGWRIGDAVYNQGLSLLDDVVGSWSWVELLLFNLTGRRPAPALLKWVEWSFICVSWPDARIWCNQVAALGASSQASGVASTSAGILAAESKLYGPGVLPSCYTLLSQLVAQSRSGESIADMVASKQKLPGFTRPIALGDERVKAMQAASLELGFKPGEFERTAIAISDYISDSTGESLNFGGYIVAFLADQGFSCREITELYTYSIAVGALTCYTDVRNDIPGGFLPLRCEDIRYEGPADRELPKSQ
ncbi:hypothetical protein [Neptunomonas marina]|uniref:Uncharacterized protein n=1 Tax=Neptunomonas marina TaxID=1815562 RepID=A0A437Q7Q7_9GAMM|nr:hypothetical protein [Neptunomonas marina]RVU30565.1 hypothetical protein EOE65_09585 [Neptunomonas marina]